MVDKSEKRSKNRLLIVLLFVFVVVIIGLVAGIVMMNGRNGGDEQQVVMVENADQIIDDITQTFAPMTMEETKAYLSQKMDEYKGTNLEFPLKMLELRVYYSNGYFEEAVEEAMKIDESSLSEIEKMNYYLIIAL